MTSKNTCMGKTKISVFDAREEFFGEQSNPMLGDLGVHPNGNDMARGQRSMKE